MKSVAVSQRIDWIQSRSEHRDSLDQKLSDLLVEVGFLSFPVPNGIKYSKTRHIDSWLEKLSPDAVLLSGGNDIAEFDSRDQVEKILINHAIYNSLPILGICRGMQMLGIHFGATLERINEHAGTRHELVASEENPAQFSKTVNSYHNFSLKDLPNEIEIIATDSKGSCEAFRHKTLPIEAWMWHPERENPYVEQDLLNLKRVLNND